MMTVVYVFERDRIAVYRQPCPPRVDEYVILREHAIRDWRVWCVRWDPASEEVEAWVVPAQ